MHHTCATFVAAGNTANTNQPPVQDGIMVIQNSHFLPQRDMYLLYGYHSGVTEQRARITTPKTRQISPIFIRPINAALLPATLTRPADYRSNPFRLAALEEIAVESTNSAVGPNNSFTVLGLSPGPSNPPASGDVYTMRGTGTGTAGAAAWTQIVMTWADTLPAGRYQCVGLNASSATMIAARLIFDQQAWRPGCIGGVDETTIQDQMFRFGGLGVWGEFNAYAMPNVEVLCNAADAAYIVYLDLIRIS